MTVRNQYLFTQAYLDRVMADSSHDEAAATLGQGLSDWAAFRDDASLSTLIDSWVGPVLDILGFHHQGVEGQPGLARLYTDFTAQELLGLCLTVPPGADIDSTIKGAHYAFQIIDALWKEGCPWGVLTDGSHWRLVKAGVLGPYETYLEVDLGQMGTRPPAETLRVFYALFRRDAFLADEEGKTGLDEHLARSEEAAETIQKHLKDRMESVLGALCRGFVMADGRQSYTEEQRAEIFENATYLLFRILFILYAEARRLLPVGNPAYDEIGMQRLVERAVRCHKQGVPDPASTTLWDGLRGLSKAIYESDEARGVPAYNGGLFSDEDTQDFGRSYLRDCSISDPYLASALFDLTHIPDSNSPDTYEPIDYRDLSVRALGALYEGMLEYKLFLAEEKIYGIPDRKGGYQYRPATQVERPKRTYREINAGDVYFAHSPTQRKSTGSYYTPEYIVDYIVKRTVERGLRERREPLEARLTDWLGEVDGALDDAERTRLQEAIDRELLHFVEKEVLTFRVCDPAMGSGHFLVNAAHTMANFIVQTLNLAPWENAELDSDPLAWRRRLVESCICGVDLNPLAVELAKLSLWLATVAQGKPLSFLDHHLRGGNSLIGVSLEELAAALVGIGSATPSRQERKVREAGQLSMLDDPAFLDHVTAAADLLAQISTGTTDKVEDVEAQAADYEKVRAELEPYQRLANILTARHFGVEVDGKELPRLARYVIDNPSRSVVEFDSAQSNSARAATTRRFFHWPLEFPEVLLPLSGESQQENGGFDAIVGNPPYLGFKEWGADARFAEFVKAHYGAYDWHADLMYYFIEIGMRLSRRMGRVSYITSRYFMHSPSGENLRNLMKPRLIRIVDFEGYQVFPEAGIHTCVWLLGPLQDPESGVLVCRLPGRFETSASIREYIGRVRNYSSIPRATAFAQHDKVATRVVDGHVCVLENLAVARAGMQTGRDSVFVKAISKETGGFLGRCADGTMVEIEADLVYPFVKNSEVRRFAHSSRLFCLHIPDGITETHLASRYPGAFAFLHSYKSDLLSRRSSFKLIHEGNWFEWMHSSQDHFADQKIIGPYRSSTNRFSLAQADETGKTVLGSIDVSFVVPTRANPHFLLAVLNSRLLEHVYQSYAKRLSGDLFDYYPNNLRRLPIRRIAFTTPLAKRHRLVAQGRSLHSDGLETSDFGAAIRFVAQQLRSEYEPDLALLEAHNSDSFNEDYQIAPGDLVDRCDVVHDLLAHLAQEMIEMNKEKQAEAKGFLDWLAAYTGLPIQDWRLKTIVKAYWQHDWDEVRRALTQNRKTIEKASGRNVEGGATLETIQSKFDQSVTQLKPVLQRIASTDRLIDLILYRLYGLTEEEVAIVEGRT